MKSSSKASFFYVVVVLEDGDEQGLAESSRADEEGISVFFEFFYGLCFVDVVVVSISDCFKVSDTVGDSLFHVFHHRRYYSTGGCISQTKRDSTATETVLFAEVQFFWRMGKSREGRFCLLKVFL